MGMGTEEPLNFCRWEVVFAVALLGSWILLVVGLVSSGLVLAWAVGAWRRRCQQPRLALSIQISGDEPTRGPLNGPFVVVTVRNCSRTRPVQIAACAIGIHRTDEVFRELTNSTVALAPYSLEPGMRFRFWAETGELALALVQAHRRGHTDVIGVCFDVNGDEYRTRPLRFSMEKYLHALARVRA